MNIGEIIKIINYGRMKIVSISPMKLELLDSFVFKGIQHKGHIFVVTEDWVNEFRV